MSNANDIRKAHKILDALLKGKMVLEEEREFLRNALPELPKQKTLEEIIVHVNSALFATGGSNWPAVSYGSLEDWLCDLREQLCGLQDTPVNAPALPTGMRIAEHENFGRVVVSPGVGIDGCHEIFYLDPGMSSGTDISEVEPDSLTFIDAEPAKPAHPEFLKTEADYESAPDGTIVARSNQIPWVKSSGKQWSCLSGAVANCSMSQNKPRRVLRWGWGND